MGLEGFGVTLKTRKTLFVLWDLSLVLGFDECFSEVLISIDTLDSDILREMHVMLFNDRIRLLEMRNEQLGACISNSTQGMDSSRLLVKFRDLNIHHLGRILILRILIQTECWLLDWYRCIMLARLQHFCQNLVENG